MQQTSSESNLSTIFMAKHPVDKSKRAQTIWCTIAHRIAVPFQPIDNATHLRTSNDADWIFAPTIEFHNIGTFYIIIIFSSEVLYKQFRCLFVCLVCCLWDFLHTHTQQYHRIVLVSFLLSMFWCKHMEKPRHVPNCISFFFYYLLLEIHSYKSAKVLSSSFTNKSEQKRRQLCWNSCFLHHMEVTRVFKTEHQKYRILPMNESKRNE